ncbi:MAG: PQQ-binding-like beta-propeller repeat protein [Candidatus Latescibacteria bacterium]|nr:PQQ-binding-like beta-propeller repeat protein [Candidatus Latescibacterota bacterium]
MKMSHLTTCLASLWVCIFCSCGEGQIDISPESFTFITISDVHVPSYGYPINQPLDEASLMPLHNQKRIEEFVTDCLTADTKPDFVINNGDTGDAGWEPLLKLYQKLIRPLPDAGIPVYTVVGNHDLDYAGLGAQDLAGFFDPLGPELIGKSGTRYSFDHKGCHFVIINNRPISGLIRLNPEELAWLRDDLKPVKKNTPVLLFMHANMEIDDTCRIVEILQPFSKPVIFHGHKHTAGIEKWGNIPVILTGSLYGGTPEAGSYNVMTVYSDSIVVRTHDYAKPIGTFEPAEIVVYPKPGPVLDVIEPAHEAELSGKVRLLVKTEPSSPGTAEFSFPGFSDWAPMQHEDGNWEAAATLPESPGRYFLAFRFTNEDGTVSLAHRIIKVPGEKVRELWSKYIGSAVQGAPVICSDLVIIPSIEGGVYAFRLENGSEIWQRNADTGQIIGRMVTDGETVYYGAGRTVHACEAATGKSLWQTSLTGTIIAGLTIENDKLFIPAGEHTLYCLDASSGNILWDYTVPQPIIMEPAADKNLVCFGAMDGRLRALDTATGKEIWNIQWSSPEDSYTTAPYWPPVIAGNKVIISKNPAGKEEKNLAAFSASNGKVIWSCQFPAGRYRLALNPDKNKLYASYFRNRQSGVQCLTVSDGSVLWSEATGVSMTAGIVNKTIALARDGYSMCCVDADTGEIYWTYRTNTGPQGSLYGPGAFAVKDNTAVVGTMDGQVIALKW